MDLDSNLAWLADAAVPDLSAIDGAALTVRAQAQTRRSRGTLALAFAVSLGIGIVGEIQALAQAQAWFAAFRPSLSRIPLIALGQE